MWQPSRSILAPGPLNFNPVVPQETFEYDNAGHLWRSNTGDGLTKVTFGKGRLPEPRKRCDGTRRQDKGSCKQRLGLVWLAYVKVEAPEPDQCRDIARLQCEDSLEIVFRPSRFSSMCQKESEIVGPPHVGGRQRLRIAIAGLGSVVIFGGVKEHAELAEGGCEVG